MHTYNVSLAYIELEFLGNSLKIIRLHSKYWVSMQQNVLNWKLWLSIITKLIFAVLKKPKITWNFWHGLGSTYLDELCPKHKKRPSKGQKRTITKFLQDTTCPYHSFTEPGICCNFVWLICSKLQFLRTFWHLVYCISKWKNIYEFELELPQTKYI